MPSKCGILVQKRENQKRQGKTIRKSGPDELWLRLRALLFLDVTHNERLKSLHLRSIPLAREKLQLNPKASTDQSFQYDVQLRSLHEVPCQGEEDIRV